MQNHNKRMDTLQYVKDYKKVICPLKEPKMRHLER